MYLSIKFVTPSGLLVMSGAAFGRDHVSSFRDRGLYAIWLILTCLNGTASSPLPAQRSVPYLTVNLYGCGIVLGWE